MKLPISFASTVTMLALHAGRALRGNGAEPCGVQCRVVGVGEGQAMSPPGRPKGEYRSAQRVGCLMSPPGRPKANTAVRSNAAPDERSDTLDDIDKEASMLHRRRLIVATAALAIGLPQFVRAQSSTADAEAALLQTVRAYFAAWNRRDTEAWAQFLAEDIEWVYAYSNLKKGRATVAAYGASALRQYDAKLEVVKLKLYDGGTRATVLLRGQMLELPVRDGKYVRAFDRDPLLARWRLEGATWRMYYMNQNVPESEELAKAEGLD